MPSVSLASGPKALSRCRCPEPKRRPSGGSLGSLCCNPFEKHPEVNWEVDVNAVGVDAGNHDPAKERGGDDDSDIDFDFSEPFCFP